VFAAWRQLRATCCLDEAAAYSGPWRSMDTGGAEGVGEGEDEQGYGGNGDVLDAAAVCAVYPFL